MVNLARMGGDSRMAVNGELKVAGSFEQSYCQIGRGVFMFGDSVISQIPIGRCPR